MTLLDYQYIWAYRFIWPKEPAIIMVSNEHQEERYMESIATGSKTLRDWSGKWFPLLDLTTLNESELDMWLAFDMCPIIQISGQPGNFTTKQIKP